MVHIYQCFSNPVKFAISLHQQVKKNTYAAREGFRTHIGDALTHRLGKLLLHALTLACFCPDSMISDEHISAHILFFHVDTNPECQQQVAVSANVHV